MSVRSREQLAVKQSATIKFLGLPEITGEGQGGMRPRRVAWRGKNPELGHGDHDDHNQLGQPVDVVCPAVQLREEASSATVNNTKNQMKITVPQLPCTPLPSSGYVGS